MTPDAFGDVTGEYRAMHEAAAVVGGCHVLIGVAGSDAESFLDRVCANDLGRAPGRAVYTAMLDERAGFVSDLTALRLAQSSYLLLVGTARVRRDLAWLARRYDNETAIRLVVVSNA